MNFLPINITEKMVSPKKTTLERGLGLFLLFVWWLLLLLWGLGGADALVWFFLKATIHVLKTYPPKLLVVFADEAI